MPWRILDVDMLDLRDERIRTLELECERYRKQAEDAVTLASALHVEVMGLRAEIRQMADAVEARHRAVGFGI